MFRTFIVVLVGYVFDIATSFSGAVNMIKLSLFDQHIRTGITQICNLGVGKKDYVVLLAGMLVIFVVSVIQERNSSTSLRVMLDKKPLILRWSLTLVCLVTVLIFGIYGPGYNPAEFVYMQF